MQSGSSIESRPDADRCCACSAPDPNMVPNHGREA
jgi:hypothetical protein